MSRAASIVQFGLVALLAACADGSLPGHNSYVTPAALAGSPALSLPANLLYVTGGSRSASHPSIEVFNAQDKSPSPEPIYTIAPSGGASYGLLAVDGSNNLFVVNYYQNEAKLLVFRSGETKPDVSCLLDTVPRDTYISQGTLYVTTASYTIEEYSLPIPAGRDCPKPTHVLTDQRAQLRGTLGLWGIAVDPSGDIFDVWQSETGQRIDEFRAGSKRAVRFASLSNTYGAFYMASDSTGNLITNISGTGSYYNSIALFPHGSHRHKRFDPIDNGQYLGFAVADGGSELFAARDYPLTEVEVYAYNSTDGEVGPLLRSFTDVWYYAQSIAVFSRK